MNVSEGTDDQVVDRIAASAGHDLLDRHSDPHHNRTVLTLVGRDAPRRVATTVVQLLDLRRHTGAHPRIGVIDVVPFVPLTAATMTDAVAARDDFITWIGRELEVPAFAYGPGSPAPGRTASGPLGPGRSLPEVRRGAFVELAPDAAPPHPHPTAGAVAVGARGVLVAWNVWLAEPDLARARRVAADIRGPHLRALGLPVGDRVQVSMNLVAPDVVGPADAWDAVTARVPAAGAELVGLVPASVLARTPTARWGQLDLAEDRTIEARLAARESAAGG